MSSKTILILLVVVLFLFGCFYLFSRKGKILNTVETFNQPPFTIKKKNRYGSRYDINTARRVDDSRSKYQVYYRDQLIAFPDALEKTTGVPGLWKAYILKDAPQPAILAGSQSLYLITQENEAYQIKPVIEQNSDFISFQ